MLAEKERINRRWRIWISAGLLCMIVLAGLFWPEVGVGESQSPSPTAASEMTWRVCVPSPTPTPRIRICDCILQQIATPSLTGTPRIIEK